MFCRNQLEDGRGRGRRRLSWQRRVLQPEGFAFYIRSLDIKPDHIFRQRTHSKQCALHAVLPRIIWTSSTSPPLPPFLFFLFFSSSNGASVDIDLLSTVCGKWLTSLSITLWSFCPFAITVRPVNAVANQCEEQADKHTYTYTDTCTSITAIGERDHVTTN